MSEGNKELLFSITRKDFEIQYYRGTGNGGQKKNKTSNCCRITHIASGAVTTSEEGRSQLHNKQNALKKLVESKTFQTWLKVKVAESNGQKVAIESWIEEQMKPSNIRVEHKEDGLWVEVTPDA